MYSPYFGVCTYRVKYHNTTRSLVISNRLAQISIWDTSFVTGTRCQCHPPSGRPLIGDLLQSFKPYPKRQTQKWKLRVRLAARVKVHGHVSVNVRILFEKLGGLARYDSFSDSLWLPRIAFLDK